MHLDAVFEDLEAQGYFQSQTKVIHQNTNSCKMLHVQLRSKTYLLSSPLIGQDFLTGFELKNNKLSWLIIPINQIQLMESADGGTELLNTESSLADLITLKLVGKVVKIVNGDAAMNGTVNGVTANTLSFVRNETITWLPIINLGVIVVEKFSDLT